MKAVLQYRALGAVFPDFCGSTYAQFSKHQQQLDGSERV